MPYLPLALASIFSQTWRDWECIIVDDGSTDGTISWLKDLYDQRITLLKNPGAGLVSALNYGFKSCTGEYIARFDADDINAPNRLERQISALDADLGLAVVCSDIWKINEDGDLIGAEHQKAFNRSMALQALTYSRSAKPIVHPSTLIRRTLLERVGGYRYYVHAEDHDLWLRLLRHGEICRIEEKLLYYRVNSSGVSITRWAEQAGNAITATFNYLVCESLAVDLYLSHSQLLKDFAGLFYTLIIDQDEGVRDHAEIKSRIGNHDYYQAAMLIIRSILFRKCTAFTSTRRRAIAKCLDQATEIVAELLTGNARPPLGLIKMAEGNDHRISQ
jgi:glycosyltransferase involved in cell wall biosynthesis